MKLLTKPLKTIKQKIRFSIFSNNLICFGISLIRLPISFLSYKMIHRLGKILGTIAYYTVKKKRTLAMNNLAVCKTLHLNEKQMKKIAKQSFQNLMMISLEYCKLSRSRFKMHELVHCENQNVLTPLKEKNTGIIFVTGHLANWELCFIEYTQYEHAMAVGRPIKNLKLYQQIMDIRRMHGGSVIDVRDALKKGVQELNNRGSFAMVNDQAFPESSYAYPLFGTRAWTSPSPALLAYRTNSPIIVVSTKRHNNGTYTYTYSKPIRPNTVNSLKKEIYNVMNQVMKNLEDAILTCPGQWLWLHKRWKQEGYRQIYKSYKYDNFLIIMPSDPKQYDLINSHLPALRCMYTRSFFSVLVPKGQDNNVNLKDVTILTYESSGDLFLKDWSYQLIFDFYDSHRLRKHFLRLGAYKALSFKQLLKKIPKEQIQLDKPHTHNFLTQSLCIPGTQFVMN